MNKQTARIKTILELYPEIEEIVQQKMQNPKIVSRRSIILASTVASRFQQFSQSFLDKVEWGLL